MVVAVANHGGSFRKLESTTGGTVEAASRYGYSITILRRLIRANFQMNGAKTFQHVILTHYYLECMYLKFLETEYILVHKLQ